MELMNYKVLTRFTDAETGRIYLPGEDYPGEGLSASPERIAMLSCFGGARNNGLPFIAVSTLVNAPSNEAIEEELEQAKVQLTQAKQEIILAQDKIATLHAELIALQSKPKAAQKKTAEKEA